MILAHTRDGSLPYGMLTHNGKQIRAHRVLYELLVGPIPEGLLLHHKCENTLCVNPDHCEPLTRAEHNRAHRLFSKWAEGLRSAEYCRDGHLWSENAYLWRGVRYCRECQAEAQRKRRAARKKPVALKATCPQGHPYEGENLVIDSRGARNCRTCLREFGRERKRRFRERRLAAAETS